MLEQSSNPYKWYTSNLLDSRGDFDVRLFQLAFKAAVQKYSAEAAKPSGIPKKPENAVIPSPVLFPPKIPCFKPKLVLDLDNTLLHAFSRSKMGDLDINLDDFVGSDNEPQLYMFSLPQAENHLYYVKLRPYVRQFLKVAAKYCTLGIHTNATREYADVIVSILDPDRRMFEDRVAARVDETGANDMRKDMDRLFGEDYTMQDLIILDDRQDVWEKNLQRNLLRCQFYGYLDSSRKALETKYGKTISIVDEEGLVDHDQQLKYLATFIEEVCTDYQRKHLEAQGKQSNSVEGYPDIRAMQEEKRKRILEGCRIMLTGFNKLDAPSAHGFHDSGPRYRQKLEMMGATVVDSLDSSSITHVVVMRSTNTTDRARILHPNAHFVHALWVVACEAGWTRIEENLFDYRTVPQELQNQPSLVPHIHVWSVLSAGQQRLLGHSDSLLTSESFSSRKRTRAEADLDLDAVVEDLPMKKNFVEKMWHSSGSYSHGAQVWSPHEHTILQYIQPKHQAEHCSGQTPFARNGQIVEGSLSRLRMRDGSTADAASSCANTLPSAGQVLASYSSNGGFSNHRTAFR